MLFWSAVMGFFLKAFLTALLFLNSVYAAVLWVMHFLHHVDRETAELTDTCRRVFSCEKCCVSPHHMGWDFMEGH